MVKRSNLRPFRLSLPSLRLLASGRWGVRSVNAGRASFFGGTLIRRRGHSGRNVDIRKAFSIREVWPARGHSSDRLGK